MFSNPSAVILMAVGEILMITDSAVIDYNDKVVGEGDRLLQEIALKVRDYKEEFRKYARDNVILEEAQHD